MTRTHVAFLRGINLGRRRLSMDVLRGHFENLGLANVATFIASGNVVFALPDREVDRIEERIEAHLAVVLGYQVDTLVRPLDRLVQLAQLAELAQARAQGFDPHVIFLRAEAGRALADALLTLETPDDRFTVLGREVVWSRRGRLTDSTVDQRALGKALAGMSNTMRNLNTIQRMAKKFASEPPVH